MSSVSVPVIDDMSAEGGDETFDIMLNVPSSLGPAITAGGRNRAIGVIIDTTSECIQYYVITTFTPQVKGSSYATYIHFSGVLQLPIGMQSIALLTPTHNKMSHSSNEFHRQ